MQKYDVAIIGAGFVGYTAALALADMGFSTLIIEAKKRDLSQLPQQDGRAIALAYTSCLLLKNLNVWPRLQAQANPIKTVHTSQQGLFGKCRMRASDLNLDYLGQVIPAPALGLALAQAALEQELITELAPASVIDINLQAEQAFITVQHAEQIQKITASIVLACDGTQSHWREQFALQTETLAAKQHAIIANVETSKPHLDCAYERFTELGTLALLPLKNKRMTSVLSVDQERYQALQQYSDADYLTLLQQQFGKRLGELCGLGKRFSYPLQSVHCRDMQRDRFLLLGNAVHTINPIAAQGLNLALRDIAVLIDCLQAEGLHVQALSTYVEKVLPAHEKMRKFTDNLVRVAKHKYLRHARSIGLLALDVAPMAKYSLANTLAGFSEHRGKKLQAVQDVL